MTSDQWDASTDPAVMLEYLTGRSGSLGPGGTGILPNLCATPRKFRLFAAACCRAIWPLLTDPRSRHAVEVAERYADGLATMKELAYADGQATEANFGYENQVQFAPAWVAYETIEGCLVAAERIRQQNGAIMDRTAGTIQADILRDLFAPFRPVTLCGNPNHKGRSGFAVSYCDDCRRIRTSTVLELARAAYASGNPLDPAALAVTADALESEGCTDQDMLMHLRGMERCSFIGPNAHHSHNCSQCGGTGYRPRPTPCYRGCAVVDAICGKE